jgi:hypothetical protein
LGFFSLSCEFGLRGIFDEGVEEPKALVLLFEIVDLPLLLKTDRTIVYSHLSPSSAEYSNTSFINQYHTKRDPKMNQPPKSSQIMYRPVEKCGGWRSKSAALVA